MPNVDANGIFMMESSPYSQQLIAGSEPKTKSKKNKKKKNKKEDDSAAAPKLRSNGQNADDMVTLKNPMFFGGYSGGDGSGNGISSNISGNPNLRPDQHAAIIKNENGMYTIRNPAFYNATPSGPPPGLSNPVFNASMPTPIATQNLSQTALNSQNSMNLPNSTMNSMNLMNSQNGNGNHDTPRYEGNNFQQSTPFREANVSFAPSKPYSAIGSEMKTVLQRKAAMYPNSGISKQDGMSFDGQGGAYSHFGGIGAQPAGNFNSFGIGGNSFGDANNFQNGHYSGQQHKYEDINFLQNLQPGQQLNSEVIILFSLSSSLF